MTQRIATITLKVVLGDLSDADRADCYDSLDIDPDDPGEQLPRLAEYSDKELADGLQEVFMNLDTEDGELFAGSELYFKIASVENVVAQAYTE